MTDWYTSSVAHAAVPVFAVSTGYTVGNFVRRITSTPKAQWVMRCTVAGTSAASEPTWPTTNNGTVVSGTATFANVTGQSAYGWSAAAGDIPTLNGAVGTARFVAGDRMFVSSDHSETQTANTTYGAGGAVSFTAVHILSVNRAGSVPPVAGDLLAGATCTVSGSQLTLDTGVPIYHYGLSYACSGATGIAIGASGNYKTAWLDACQLYLNNAASTGARIASASASTLVLHNSTVKFSHANQCFNAQVGPLEIIWLNTASAIAAGSTIPSAQLFVSSATTAAVIVTARGVDLSALTTCIATPNAAGAKILLDSCRIASGVVRFNPSLANNTRDIVELVNCYDGTNIVNESHQPAGVLTTERTIVLSGGATDDVGVFSHKLVSNTTVDKYVNPLVGFWLDVEQQAVGTSKTATVEIISSASLNNDEISLVLEFQGTASSPVATITTTLPATVLTTAAAVTTSTATWSSSPPTPVKQKLEVVFTPLVAGRVRGQVRLGRASTTTYYNPVITIT